MKKRRAGGVVACQCSLDTDGKQFSSKKNTPIEEKCQVLVVALTAVDVRVLCDV